MACRFTELALDSRDSEALAAFWAAVLDYRVLPREDGNEFCLLRQRLDPL